MAIPYFDPLVEEVKEAFWMGAPVGWTDPDIDGHFGIGAATFHVLSRLDDPTYAKVALSRIDVTYDCLVDILTPEQCQAILNSGSRKPKRSRSTRSENFAQIRGSKAINDILRRLIIDCLGYDAEIAAEDQIRCAKYEDKHAAHR